METRETAAEHPVSHPLLAMEAHDLEALKTAYGYLEYPSLAARLSSVLGTPIETAMALLPPRWSRQLHNASETAITRALETAVNSLHRRRELVPHPGFYKGLVAGSGALGGFFGLPGLLLEIPVTTTLMLRAIAEIAREEGETLTDPRSRAACLEVFALGGRTEIDDAAETGYYGVRLVLAGYLSSSLSAVLGGDSAAPALVGLVRAVAARFGVTLSQRAAAQLVPVIGAVGAATINTIFMQHFQGMARGHFTVRRLERKYGPALVEANYETLARNG
jgi:hypothetical protein